jgi:hypothetical protein
MYRRRKSRLIGMRQQAHMAHRVARRIERFELNRFSNLDHIPRAQAARHLGILSFAFLCAIILAPVFCTIAALPPVWSRCSCVFRICVIYQPRLSLRPRMFS